jgi:tRNA(fMet)-specific endonuclease VapC
VEDVVVLDTNVLFDFLADMETAEETENILINGKGAVSAITVYEMFQGVTSKKHLDQRVSLLSHLHVLDITTRVARKAGKIYTYLREKGFLVSNEDILIAASCIFYKISLLTKNKSHFEHIQGIRLYEARKSFDTQSFF